MKKNEVEKEIKIISVFILLAGVTVLILHTYSIYSFGKIKDLLDVYYFIFGVSLIIAGYGLFGFESWARKTMLYTMSIYLIVGIYDLCCSIVSILPQKAGNVNIDKDLISSAVLAIFILFALMVLLPFVSVFHFLNKKAVKEIFQNKVVKNQTDNPPLSFEKEKESSQ
jgi:hypothetical protein